MAKTIDATELKRSDLYSVTPEDIIVSEDDRGRSTPPSDTVIKQLALSILAHGQRQAIECRKDVGNKLRLNMGFTRYEAVMLIRKGFEYNGTTYHDPNFLLKTTVSNTNAETAFIHNIVENAHRNATSPVDDAINQQKLRNRYGKNDADIAELYQCTVTHVQRMASLLGLSAELQTKVHEGTLPVSAAIDLLAVPEDKRDEILALATDEESAKVSGQAVKAQVRDAVINSKKDKGDTTKAPRSTMQRTVKEIRAFFEIESQATGDSGGFAKVVVEFINGELTAEDFKSSYDEYLGVS